MDDTETNNLNDKRKKNVIKRRSVILQRRSIGRSKGNETIAPNTDDQESTSSSHKPFDLEKHIENLENENRMWRELLKERKLRCSELRKEQETQNGQEFDPTLLTDSQQSWLAEQTDYKKFMQNAEKLREMAVKSVTLRAHLDKLNDSLMSNLNNEIAKTSKRIINFVD